MRIVKSTLLFLLTALLTLNFSNVSFAAVADRINGSLAGATVALQGNVHHQAQSRFDQGPADPALKLGSMTLQTVPTASQQQALRQLLADQQNPKSPSFRKWLTPEQWADQFGLSQGDINTLTQWLKDQSFKIEYVARGRNWITFSGTAAQVQSTFATEFHRYNVNGEMHVANATAPKIPAALSGIVVSISGLNDFHLKPSVVKARPPRANYFDTITNIPSTDFLAPGDIATIYDIDALYNLSPAIDGTGQKLAVIGQTDVYLADLNDFRSGFGLTQITGCTSDSVSNLLNACTVSSTANFQYVLVSADPNFPLPDITEADLDLEWSAAVARGAQIIYVNAPVNGLSGGVEVAWPYAIDNVIAPVISLSYGACEFAGTSILDPTTGAPLTDEMELMKANSEGITFMNSSGDSGAAGCDAGQNTATNPPNLALLGLAVSYPASSPEVTGVGGTAVDFTTGFSSTYWGTTNAPDGGSAQNPPIPETSWNDDEELPLQYSGTTQSQWQENYAIVASGGGPSNCAQQNTSLGTNCVAGFGKPSWQNVTLSGIAPARFSPDVSLLGSPNFPGYIFCTPLNAWTSSASTSSTCALGIPNALSEVDPSGNPAPSLVGGTSASAPIFAGMVVLLNQYLGTTGLGNINPTLYALAATSSAGAFHPATTGDNTVYCEVGQPPAPWPTALQCPTTGVFGWSADVSDATTGYNLVTGLGSVDADLMATNWNAAATTAGATFTMTPSVATFPVTQGASVTASVNVIVPSTFSGTITFTCTDPAPLSTCTVPASVTASGTVSFSITTTASSAAAVRPADGRSRIFYAALLPGLLGVMFTAGSRRRTARGMRLLGLVIMLAFSTLWLASCGGSSSGGGGGGGGTGTTAGSYNVTVTGTSGSTIVSTSFQIVVQ